MRNKKISEYSFINAIIISVFLHLLFFLLILNIKVLNLTKNPQEQIISYIQIENPETPTVKKLEKTFLPAKPVFKEKQKKSDKNENLKKIILKDKVLADESINKMLEQTPENNVFYTETAEIKRISMIRKKNSQIPKKQVEKFELLSKILDSIDDNKNIKYDNIITNSEDIYNYDISDVQEEINQWKLENNENYNYKKVKRKLIYQPVPEVPNWLEKKGISTFIVFKALINKDGTIKNIDILKSSGFARIDRDAVLYVSRWKYEPADYEEIRYPRVIFLVRKKQIR